ncbi:MAG: DUF2461 domain-containing protein [Gammaproteobacteria bacterium]
MNSAQFTGFPEDMFQFLLELSANNNRAWFSENKPRYQTSVVEPVTGFIEAMVDELERISPYFCTDPRSHRGSMYRIYRDTRFAKDKRPYKENVGCHFRHVAGTSAHALGFYLHLQPGNSYAGAGIWKPSALDLEKIRTAIIERIDAWAEVLSDESLSRRFGAIAGESLKRVPRGYDTDFVFVDDLKRKSFFVKQFLADELVTSGGIVAEVARAYADAAPLMRFLAVALGLPYDSESRKSYEQR